jgi:hypothetical protein
MLGRLTAYSPAKALKVIIRVQNIPETAPREVSLRDSTTIDAVKGGSCSLSIEPLEQWQLMQGRP